MLCLGTFCMGYVSETTCKFFLPSSKMKIFCSRVSFEVGSYSSSRYIRIFACHPVQYYYNMWSFVLGDKLKHDVTFRIRVHWLRKHKNSGVINIDYSTLYETN